NGKHSDRLYVPVGKPVKVRLLSADVLHSFFVPAFRIKRDTVPGMENYVWFVAKEPGSYDIFCAEYCGIGHADMKTTVEAVPVSEFEEWLSGMETAGQTEQGRELISQFGCLGCHSLDGSKSVGPSFKGIGGRQVTVLENGAEKTLTSNAAYLRRSILEPGSQVVKGYPPVMPSYAERLSAEQLKAIIDYLSRIGKVQPEGAGPKKVSRVEQGQALARQLGCLGCHSVDGSRKVGPSFKGLYGSQRPLEGGTSAVADAAYIRRALQNPGADVAKGYPAMMPPYPQLKEEQVKAILEWLESLK
ncbi:MAG: cytochrome c oxidase subunit II, partial [Deltaproteobacteria bacterium]